MEKTKAMPMTMKNHFWSLPYFLSSQRPSKVPAIKGNSTQPDNRLKIESDSCHQGFFVIFKEK